MPWETGTFILLTLLKHPSFLPIPPSPHPPPPHPHTVPLRSPSALSGVSLPPFPPGELLLSF